MEPGQTTSFALAFTAGLLSFASPCVLPLVPSYVSYITGLSLEELTGTAGAARARWLTVQNSLLFILGFSLVFIAFGASATLIGQFFLTYASEIRTAGGVLVILFGISIMGALKLPFLNRYKQYQFTQRPGGVAGPILVGVAFAAGWTPCVGPILGSILLYASTRESVASGVQLLSVYSLGLALPLFLTALGINSFLLSFRKIKDYLWVVSLVSGVFLVIVGLMLVTNSFTRLTAWLVQRGIGWSLDL
jgi:cytochrome c-type biogenesis protein